MSFLTGRDIFKDGEIVKTIQIPENIRRSEYTKKQWGKTELSNYVINFFGENARWNVESSRSHNGSLTGTNAVIIKNGKRITYMMVEPKHSRFKHEVHISKLEEDLNEGSFIDAIDYEYRSVDSSSKPESPFAAALQSVRKDELPNLSEIVRLRAQEDRIHGGLMFAPTFKTSDPFVDGKPSMYLYYTDNKPELETGKIYRARILETKNTGKTNKKGSIMVKVKVELL